MNPFAEHVCLQKPRQIAWAAVILVASSVACCDPLAAQYIPGMGANGIAAMGVGQLSVEPQSLELSMRVQAKGTDAKSAAKALAAHKERVRKDLTAMNADPGSIQFSATRFESGQSEEQQYAMQMMRRQMGSSSTAAAGAGDSPAIVTAVSNLKVQWTLPKVDREALAILPQGLKEQVVSRDLAGKANQPELDEATRESVDELEAMMEESFGSFSFSSGDSNRSGPRIVFVATASAEQRQEATKQAIAQARQSAELIAAAADIQLGRLKSIAANDQSFERMQTLRFGGYGDSGDEPLSEGDNRIMSATLDGLKLVVSLMAVYEL